MSIPGKVIDFPVPNRGIKQFHNTPSEDSKLENDDDIQRELIRAVRENTKALKVLIEKLDASALPVDDGFGGRLARKGTGDIAEILREVPEGTFDGVEWDV